jgi:hypothetical protein
VASFSGFVHVHDTCHLLGVCRNYQRVTSARVNWVKTSQGNDIISAYVPFQDGRGKAAKLTLLYSHGNAVDLGQMLPVYK